MNGTEFLIMYQMQQVYFTKAIGFSEAIECHKNKIEICFERNETTLEIKWNKYLVLGKYKILIH